MAETVSDKGLREPQIKKYFHLLWICLLSSFALIGRTTLLASVLASNFSVSG